MRRDLILHHGLFGFDKIEISNFRLNYWGSAPELLKKLGYNVHITKVSPVHSIEERSRSLREFIKSRGLRDAHLICHSLGGLDARHMLDKYRHDDFNIRTLTTLGTPHKGSEFMDLLSQKLGLGYRYSLIEAPKPKTMLYQLLYYLDQPAYSCLTTEYSKEFNKTVQLNPKVDYYSIGANFKCDKSYIHDLANTVVNEDISRIPILKIITLKSLEDYMGLLERIMFLLAGDNDGLVSLKSSNFGNYLATLDGSHWDLVDKSGRFGNKMLESVEEMYTTIVANLKKYDE